MNKNYLDYLFKSKKSLCLVIALLYVSAYVICFTVNDFGEAKCIASFGSSSIILGILCYVMVPLVYSYIHNKKAVDMHFALPVSRKEMLITSQIFIDLVIAVPFLVLAIISLIIGLNSGVIISVNAYLIYVVIAIIGVIVVTMFEAAVFLEANSTFDGIVLMGAYLLMPLMLFLTVNAFQSSLIAGFNPLDEEKILSYLSMPVALIGNELANGEAACFEKAMSPTISLSLIICLLWHAVVSVIGLKKNFINRKVERAETISNNFFSYPFVIYFYAFSLIFFTAVSSFNSMNFTDVLFVYFIIFVCFMVATFIYRRKIQIKLKDIALYIGTIIIALAFTFVANSTKGFGLSYVYDRNPKNIAVYYYHYNNIANFTNNDKIQKLVEESYPDVYEYNIRIEGFIKEKDMDKAKDALKIIEEKRNEAIDNQYLKGQYSNCNFQIITNYDETTINDELGLSQRLNSLSKKDRTNYLYASRVTYDEMMTLNKYLDVEFDIWVNNDEYGMYMVSLDELLNNAKAQS